MHIERIMKYNIPVKASGKGLKAFLEVLEKHGRRMSMEKIKSEIEQRFGA